jgi:hypothetical protein
LISKNILFLVRNKHDLKKAISLKERIGCVFIIAIHPYAVYYALKNNLHVDTLESVIPCKIRRKYLVKAVKLAEKSIENFDNLIYKNFKNNRAMLKDVEQFDFTTVATPIMQYYVLDFLQKIHKFSRVIISDECSERNLNGNFRYWSSTSWLSVVELHTKKHGLKLSKIKYQNDSFEYSHSIKEKVKSIIQPFIPDSIIKIIRNKTLGRAYKKLKPTLEPYKGRVIFLEPLRGEFKQISDEMQELGVRVFAWDVSNSGSNNYVHLFDSDKNSILKHTLDIDIKQEKQLIMDVLFYSKSIIQECFFIKEIDFSMSGIVSKYIIRIIKDTFLNININIKKFDQLIRQYGFNYSISYETYLFYLSGLMRVEDRPKHIGLFHGPRFSSSYHSYRSVWARALHDPDVFLIDGPATLRLVNNYAQSSSNRSSYITGALLYTKGKGGHSKPHKGIYEGMCGDKIDILYLPTKLIAPNNTINLYHTNTIYIKDHFRIMKKLSEIGLNKNIVVKYKAMGIGEGQPFIPSYNDFKNLKYINNESNVSNLSKKSEIVIIDSLGTTLIEALTHGCKVILLNRYDGAFDFLDEIKESVYYCSSIEEVEYTISNIDNIQSKNNTFLDLYNSSRTSEEVLLKRKAALTNLFN